MDLDDETLAVLGYGQHQWWSYSLRQDGLWKSAPTVRTSSKPDKAAACGVDGCDEVPYGRQRYCKRHHEKMRRCKVDGCDGTVYRSSRCKAHQ